MTDEKETHSADGGTPETDAWFGIGDDYIPASDEESGLNLCRNLDLARNRLQAENEELRAVIAQHDLCHNLHGKVDAESFADGCAAEQRKLYGCAPHADQLASLRKSLEYAGKELPDAPRFLLSGSPNQYMHGVSQETIDLSPYLSKPSEPFTKGSDYNALRQSAIALLAKKNAESKAECERLKVGLRYYANQYHFILSDDNAWDTVSGEPQNFWCDEAGTATIEDGAIAKSILRGENINWIDGDGDGTPPPIEGEADAARGSAK